MTMALGASEHVAVTVNEIEILIPVKRQSRKSLALHLVKNEHLEIRAPLRMPLNLIRQYVAEQQSWVEKALRKSEDAPAASKLRYEHGAMHWFLGEQYRLSLQPATRFFAHVADGEIRLAVNKLDSVSVNKALQKFYLREAEMRLPERVRFFHRKMYQRELPELSFRAMKSRWGSCASDGGITLNTCLLRAPLPVIDYVIVHELAHLTHFNHSARFHALVAYVFPDWKQRSKALVVPCGF